MASLTFTPFGDCAFQEAYTWVLFGRKDSLLSNTCLLLPPGMSSALLEAVVTDAAPGDFGVIKPMPFIEHGRQALTIAAVLPEHAADEGGGGPRVSGAEVAAEGSEDGAGSGGARDEHWGEEGSKGSEGSEALLCEEQCHAAQQPGSGSSGGNAIDVDAWDALEGEEWILRFL